MFVQTISPVCKTTVNFVALCNNIIHENKNIELKQEKIFLRTIRIKTDIEGEPLGSCIEMFSPINVVCREEDDNIILFVLFYI